MERAHLYHCSTSFWCVECLLQRRFIDILNLKFTHYFSLKFTEEIVTLFIEKKYARYAPL